ncbi:ABC-type metal ion transport system, periplasmic component/surface adhesin [Thermoanaerobacter kivui]|uniref:ABC-type metal ion transport system, periplasmic component/surface adhesin n=1 Tax=Thermoanaerobacter kivui TaxID=2325 RepID=A0A097ANV7_THEKI|nr:metal ABC transporter substrate-binding protein [Thermoanaerobacter kivui]AIS51497.1 ABC-type metal ion transport system, periplasmic component/surface adhesin [Thermoanaerobacter kivui]
MKKALISMILIMALVLGLTSCGTKTAEPSKPVVYASFYPIYDLSSKIGGNKIVVKTIIPSGVEPHDWEPTTKDVAEMTKANTILYLGLGMDSWIDKIKSNAPNVAFYEVSKGVNPIKYGNETNPHIWLSPKEALIMAKNIKEALQKADPKSKDYFEKNYQSLKNTLENLDKEYTDALSQTKHKTFIVYHSAFDYLARDYGLKQEALVGMNEEAEASPARIGEIINLIKKENIKYIFTEPLTSPKPIQTIAKETGVQVLPLNTIEGLTKEDIKKKEDYISLMKQNLENLIKALE